MKIPLNMLLAAAALLYTCSPTGTGDDGNRLIVINEFMSANSDDGPTDEHGDSDDWIELYNNGENEISVADLYLSDDSLQLHAYSFPDTVIAPGGFLLVWADDEPLEGKWHAPFQLSWQNGDEIILTKGRDRIVDRYRFFPENGNPTARVPGTSFGRAGDGDTLWGQQTEPSPGAPNRGIREWRTD